MRGDKLKIIGISFLLFGALLSLVVIIDILAGQSFHAALTSAITPFTVMDPAEYIIIGVYILYYLGKTAIIFFKKKKNGETKKQQSQQ